MMITAGLLKEMTVNTDLLFESVDKIRNTFPMMSAENAIALTSASVCPS